MGPKLSLETGNAFASHASSFHSHSPHEHTLTFIVGIYYELGGICAIWRLFTFTGSAGSVFP